MSGQMKRVLLIGDSIRVSYQKKVAELLEDIAQVSYPGENSRFTKFALWSVEPFIHDSGIAHFDCIHWNTGIWDMHRNTVDGNFTSIDEYVRDSERLRRQLAQYSDKLIWATTTPGGSALDEHLRVLDNAGTGKFFLCDTSERWNADVRLYNGAACGLLAPQGVEINDLYALISSDPDRYISGDGIHLSPDGVTAAAVQTAAAIRRTIGG